MQLQYRTFPEVGDTDFDDFVHGETDVDKTRKKACKFATKVRTLTITENTDGVTVWYWEEKKRK